MNIKLNNFNIDAKNGIASFNFVDFPPGYAGVLPSVNIVVKVQDVANKTGTQMYQDARQAAKKLLSEVMTALDSTDLLGS